MLDLHHKFYTFHFTNWVNFCRTSLFLSSIEIFSISKYLESWMTLEQWHLFSFPNLSISFLIALIVSACFMISYLPFETKPTTKIIKWYSFISTRWCLNNFHNFNQEYCLWCPLCSNQNQISFLSATVRRIYSQISDY